MYDNDMVDTYLCTFLERLYSKCCDSFITQQHDVAVIARDRPDTQVAKNWVSPLSSLRISSTPRLSSSHVASAVQWYGGFGRRSGECPPPALRWHLSTVHVADVQVVSGRSLVPWGQVNSSLRFNRMVNNTFFHRALLPT